MSAVGLPDSEVRLRVAGKGDRCILRATKSRSFPVAPKPPGLLRAGHHTGWEVKMVEDSWPLEAPTQERLDMDSRRKPPHHFPWLCQ